MDKTERYNHIHNRQGHPLSLTTTQDAAGDHCPDCGRTAEEPYNHAFDCPAYRPHPGSVTWARGQVPTPHGPLRVSWVQGGGQGGGRAFTLAVTAPRGTSGDVAVPVGGTRVTVRVDGRAAWNDGAALAYQATNDGGFVTLHGVPAGSHTVTVTGR